VSKNGTVIKRSNLVEYSFWSWKDGRTGWSGSILNDNETEIEELKETEDKEIGKYNQYAEDNEWRYYKFGDEPFDMATRLRVKKLKCKECGCPI
jgi:hypothetical protein